MLRPGLPPRREGLIAGSVRPPPHGAQPALELPCSVSLTGTVFCRLAELTEGYSGSDLRQLCVQAALRPVRELLEREGKAAAAQQAKQAQHAEQQPTQQQAAAVQGGSGAGSENGEGEGGSGGGAAGKEFGEEPVETGGAGLVVVELDAVQQPEVHGSAEVSAAESEPGEGEALPYDAQQLGQLLEAAQGIAGEAGGPREELRPITMQVGRQSLAASMTAMRSVQRHSRCQILPGAGPNTLQRPCHN